MLLFLIIVLLVFVTQFLLHSWWIAAIDGFVAALFFSKSGWQAFIAGFLGVGVIWGGYAFYINQSNENLLADKIAQIFSLPGAVWLLVLTTLIGALIGGFSALTGYSLRALFIKKK